MMALSTLLVDVDTDRAVPFQFTQGMNNCENVALVHAALRPDISSRDAVGSRVAFSLFFFALFDVFRLYWETSTFKDSKASKATEGTRHKEWHATPLDRCSVIRSANAISAQLRTSRIADDHFAFQFRSSNSCYLLAALCCSTPLR